jgi:hypothetical protein
MNRPIARECVLYVLAALVCSATAFADETPQTKDCRLRQLASIDLKIGSIVLIPVVLDGAPAFMGLNTGLPISTISQQAAAEMKFAIVRVPRSFTNSPGLVPIDSLSLGSYDTGPERSAAYLNCYGSPPLTIGLDLLRHLRLYFATEEHILYFTAADAGRPAAASEP